MGTYALVQNGLVVNTILWDGKSQCDFGDGVLVIESDGSAQIGFEYDGASFKNLNAPLPMSLDDAKADQIAKNNAACQAEIVSGFTSSATGKVLTYPSKITDQQNLNASVVASLIPGIVATWVTPFWCADVDGNWSYVYHTATQIQKVGQDGKSAILTCLAKNEQLKTQIAAATTTEQVQSITW